MITTRGVSSSSKSIVAFGCGAFRGRYAFLVCDWKDFSDEAHPSLLVVQLGAPMVEQGPDVPTSPPTCDWVRIMFVPLVAAEFGPKSQFF